MEQPNKQPQQQFQKPASAPTQQYDKDFRHIVRIINTDLDGKKQILDALRKIKGIGFMYANTICYCTNIDKKKITGQMSDSEIQKIEDVLRNPKKYNIPVWMFNRKKDYETGENFHLIGTDLNLAVDNDMKNMKKIKSYKGIRHMQGQPVRGQRTKSNFRKNKGKVSLGVVKKRVGAPAPEEKEKKGKK